ncbi:hypothetical protein OKA05_28670 [Luteolibacter arcticus]|uniref:Uncharacterized protein n=2 Tax=Luteolibacter arcticus TaxID=1581411 RepID=A0ABT3GSR1_9BACT|nr:hypothetical protein [Luteolibacter arcticus]
MMGETVGVGIPDGVDESGMERFSKLIYLFPITDDEWGICAPGLLVETHYSRRYNLEMACEVARKFLTCEFLPLDPKSVLVHCMRGPEGDSQVAEHVPTGTRMWLMPVGGRLFKSAEAMDEMVYRLALGECADDDGRAG